MAVKVEAAWAESILLLSHGPDPVHAAEPQLIRLDAASSLRGRLELRGTPEGRASRGSQGVRATASTVSDCHASPALGDSPTGTGARSWEAASDWVTATLSVRLGHSRSRVPTWGSNFQP
eukprot:298339-Rhodomonas_salina.1